MGIQGLQKFIDRNNILEDCDFRDNKLIIDGNNLFNLLYYKSKLDQLHGGDYDEFEDLVTKFINNLKDCKIQPYVVFDGNDIDGKKSDTLRQRAISRIKKACKFSNNDGKEGSVLPLLTKTVFRQVLRKLDVPMVQCLIEADQEIAALATEFDCPILSEDTDFYIYNINQGVLPYYHFEWTKPQEKDKQMFIPGKRFTVTRLCAHFNMNPDLVPLFATVLSNKLDLVKNIFLKITEQPNQDNIICSLLKWLSDKSKDYAISDLINNLEGNEEERNSFRAKLQDCINAYMIPTSSTRLFFETEAQPDWTAEPLRALPDWSLLPMAKGELNTMMVDVLVHKAVTLKGQAEDFSKKSSNKISKKIRKVIYGLLLYNEENSENRTDNEFYITEFDRDVQNLKKLKSEKLKIQQTYNLRILRETPRENRLKILKDALDIPNIDLQEIADHLHLVIYITLYWRRESQADDKLIKAVLLGLVYGELSKRSRKENEASRVFQTLHALKVPLKELDKNVAHYYCQWQCCLKDGIRLNQFLCLPVPEPECARLYNGSLVHNLAINPESTLKELEGEDDLKLYQKMFDFW